MVTMKVMTGMLNGHRVGRFTDLVTLGSEETLREALEYGYVTGKASSLAAVAEGVLKAMVDGIRKDGNGRKIDEFRISADSDWVRKLAHLKKRQ